jgi:hypothetical protein
MSRLAPKRRIVKPGTAKLARWQIWLLCVSGAVLWLTGGAWLLLHYFGQTQNDFGPQTNPLEPWMLRLHGLVLIPALMGLGGLMVAHIPKGWAYPHQRLPGSILAAILLVLTATGYLLYYASGETLRAASSITHWALGLAVPVIFIWHYLGKRGVLKG